MGIDATIKDGLGTAIRAEVTNQNALSVVARDYYNYNMTTNFFANSTYGIDLNQNWSNEGAGNANELIHDGTDIAAWTGSSVIGTWDFASTNNPFAGTKNIEMIGASIGDIAQIDRGSDVTMTTQTGFQGKIYLTALGHILAELLFYAWDTGTGTIVGTPVNVYDYINTSTLLSYQTFTIPLADMGLTALTFDSVRFEVAVKAGATFDMDNIYLTDPTGGSAFGSQTFTMVPNKGQQLVIDGFILTMADEYGGTVTDGTMPSIRYDGFLGLSTLDSGLVFRVINNVSSVTFVANITTLLEFFQFGHATFGGYGSDGTNSWFSLHLALPAPIVLNDDEKDRLELVLSDDLSGLKWFRWSVDARQRVIF